MNRVALITGCAKGIGRSIALMLASNGYNIIGTYNTSVNEIKELKEQFEKMNVNFDYYKVDLSIEKELNAFCDCVKEKYKKISVLINNAAFCSDNYFGLKTKKEFMKVLEVNLVAPFLIIKNLNNILDDGIIINIGSTDGINTYGELNVDYSASKAGLINLTKSFALILKKIKVYCVCPNWVDTEAIREMNPEYLREEMDRIGQKELITPISVSKKIIEIINGTLDSGSIIVMEG